MQNAIAFCDNDVVVVAWSYGHKVEGCMGFAVYRIDPGGVETALPSMAVFPGFTPKRGQTTATFPVQTSYWKDPYARLVADQSGNRPGASASSDGNAASRARLAKTAGQLIDRMLPANQIGHNKFVVHLDPHGKPAAVLFGSTNWTSTGLCAQTNNTIVCDDAQIARRYHDYWKQLAKDTTAAAGDPKALQGAALRTCDATAKTFTVGTGVKATSWFSPNTPKLR